MVCGLTPSSAATTKIAMSVTSAPRTHSREGLVTRCVDDQRAVAVGGVRHSLVRADVLGDATGFCTDHVGFADRVEQFGLTVIDVTHHGDRRLRLKIAGLALVLSNSRSKDSKSSRSSSSGDTTCTKFNSVPNSTGVIVDRLRRGDHLAETEEDLDQISR